MQQAMLEEAQSLHNKQQKNSKQNAKQSNPYDQERYVLDGVKMYRISMQETAQNAQNLEHRGKRGLDSRVLGFRIFES